MLVVQCKDCRKELTSSTGRTQSCGCPNMMTINGDSVTAVDLTRVVMVRSIKRRNQRGLHLKILLGKRNDVNVKFENLISKFANGPTYPRTLLY